MSNDGDTIYRQQAIDAMCDACSDWCDEGVCKKVSAIQKLPSAQYSDAYKAGFNKGYEKAKKEMERRFLVTSDGKIHPLTTTWLGDFSPYQCEKCGYHVDSKTRYCPDCGRRASNYDEN